jgi:hypothetical protein
LGSDRSSQVVKVIPIVIVSILLIGAFTSSCRHYPTTPNDSTKCDTCCDTCHTDTTHHPTCDTCNKSDTTSHNFEWTEYNIPDESSLTGVWVFNDTDILIIGNALWHFNGTTFTDVKPTRNISNTQLSGALNGFNIFALSRSEYWMVHGSISFHTIDGKHFDDIRPGSSNSCWGSASSDIFVVGNSGQIHHYDGTKFSDMTSGTTKDLRSVWGTNHNDVWACGYSSSKGETVLLHFDGATWKEDEQSITHNGQIGGFDAVWACDSAGHKFATTSGGLLIRKTDNGIWRSDSGLVPNRLGDGSFIGIAPFGNTPNDMMAIGPWGFIAHWNGKDWKKYDQLFDYGAPVYYTAAFSIKGDLACAVGTKSGQSWIAVGQRK